MINREDMLELSRLITPSRHCYDRVAGAYLNEDGFVDGSFKIHFGKLSPLETVRKLKLAKTGTRRTGIYKYQIYFKLKDMESS